jgi:glycosyltransferase 2 family protein
MPQVSDPPKRASAGHWKWLVSIALAAALLYYSLRGVDWGRVWTLIATARWQYIVASALIVCVSSTLRALRWRILLNAEASLGVWTVFRATMAGYLGNNFLPARAGEVIRTLLISRRSGLSKTYVLTTALSERLMDVIALVLASSIVLMGVHPKPSWMVDLSRSMAIVATLGALTVTVVPHTGTLLTSLLGRLPLPVRLHAGLAGLSEQVLLGMRAFHHWGRFGGFVALTAAIWACDALSAMVGSRALGLNLTFPVALLLLTGLGLGSALPSTPGYVGIYQFVAVSVLVPFGVSKDAALAFILITQAVGYVVVVLLGLPSFSLLREASSEMPARDGSPPASALP